MWVEPCPHPTVPVPGDGAFTELGLNKAVGAGPHPAALEPLEEVTSIAHRLSTGTLRVALCEPRGPHQSRVPQG